MSIPTPTTAASSFPWLPVAVVGGIVLFIVAFTMFKKIGRTQTQSQVAELGSALGYSRVEGAPSDAPLAEFGSLKSLTHGRSHRFAHVMRSADGSTVFQLNYDTGALHGPFRWSYMVYVLPTTIEAGSSLALAPSGPDDLASEFGFKDITVGGRTIRTQDAASAESRFGSPQVSAWLSEYSESLVEISDGYLAVLIPGDLSEGETGDPAQIIVAAGKSFVAAIAAAE